MGNPKNPGEERERLNESNAKIMFELRETPQTANVVSGVVDINANIPIKPNQTRPLKPDAFDTFNKSSASLSKLENNFTE